MNETPRAAAFLDKGGTGKTTTVAHLVVALKKLGHEVLLIDLAGKQGDLAKHFGVWGDYQARIEAGELGDVATEALTEIDGCSIGHRVYDWD